MWPQFVCRITLSHTPRFISVDSRARRGGVGDGLIIQGLDWPGTLRQEAFLAGGRAVFSCADRRMLVFWSFSIPTTVIRPGDAVRSGAALLAALVDRAADHRVLPALQAVPFARLGGVATLNDYRFRVVAMTVSVL